MAAGGKSRVSFKARGGKLKTPPAFRPGMGEVYRELERQGKIPVEGIEKKAQLQAAKAAKEEALAKQSSLWAKIKVLFAKLNHRLFD